MVRRTNQSAILLELALIASLCIGGIVQAENTNQKSSGSRRSQTQTQSNLDQQRQEANRLARPDVEKQRKEAEEEASKSIDQEAVAAVQETRKAIDAIAANKTDQALGAIEQATGKINILLARNPATAQIPVSVDVDVIDTAPRDTTAITNLAKDATKAAEQKNFPFARTLLYQLMSEIRTRTYSLPLATYPTALQEAARLLDQKKTKEASTVLLTALNTLFVEERVTPLPLVLAREEVNQAQSQAQKDKNAAQQLLESAKNHVQRSKLLGYAPDDPEYMALNDQISQLEKQINGGGNLTATFSNVKERLTAFLKRQSQHDQH